VHFPSWSIQRLKRKRRGLGHKTVALVETSGVKQVIVAACEDALGKGIRLGMTPTQARAIDAQISICPYQPDGDVRALRAAARWMMRFTPTVAVESPDSLFLDVSGLERIMGDDRTVLQRIDEATRPLRLQIHLAIAPTPGAAWALAVYGPDRCQVAPPERLRERLSELPMRALRLDSEAIQRLHQLGLHTIGQILKLPRPSLAARFGSSLLMRIDQAFGEMAEPLVGLQCVSPIVSDMEFEYAVESLETIWWILKQMIGQIAEPLCSRGQGARIIKATFRQAYAPSIEKIVHLARPSREPANLFNLLQLALETLEAQSGFTGIRLEIILAERLSPEQIPLIQHEQHAAQIEWDRLIERLGVRMEKGAVLFARTIQSHVPERAFAWVEPQASPPLAMRHQDTAYVRSARRPLSLLPLPILIGVMVSPSEDREGRPISFTYRGIVHRLPIVAGPERIGGIWWNGNDKTRDYFDVQTPTGRRFWIFRVRQTGKWYLHGIFD